MAAPMRQRRRLSALSVSAVLAFSALPLFAGAVAATDVATDAELRTAWANPLETLITLTADITLSCGLDLPSPPTRNSPTAIVVDGAGHTLHNPCPGAEALLQQGLGLVTLTDLTLTGTVDTDDGLNTEGAALVEAGSVVTGHGTDGIDTELNATIAGSTVSGNGDNGVESETNVSMSGSTASDNGESGIDAEGDVTVDAASTISDNETNGINAGGEVTVTDSTISSNTNTGIDADGDVTVTGSTISDSETECGYGIRTNGDASVDDSTITGNADSGIRAGNITVTGSDVSGNGVEGGCAGEGILAGGDVSVTDSTVTDNSDEDDGVRAGGDATILRSTISGNGDDGGSGVTGTNVEVTDSTITANASSGVEADEDATVTNSTITDHGQYGVTASVEVFATHATITGNMVNIQNVLPTTIHLFGTVLAGATFENCDGAVIDEGFNFVDDDSCGTIDEETAAPLLGALANNGGPTFTRLPLAGSPLLDAIPAGDCEETTEQRGLNPRPQGSGCDMGSVEVFVPLPAASITDVTVTEGNTGTTVEAIFTVSLSKVWSRTVTIAYATANGSATAPTDYLAETGTVSFAPGITSQTISVTVVGDALDELNETFFVNLSAPVEATIADAQGIGNIQDDEGPIVPVVPPATPQAGQLPDTATAAPPGAPGAAVAVVLMSFVLLLVARKRGALTTR